MRKLSNTAQHAERELAILAQTVPDAIVTPFSKEIIVLVDAIGRSGQSGGSNPYTVGAVADAIKKLAQFKPICPLTGHPDEWADMSHASDTPCFQNRREGAVFKDGPDGRAYYLDAIVFKDQNGCTFTTRRGVTLRSLGTKLGSPQYIKAFPFKPKTFYIDVVSAEPEPGWWESAVKDEAQLDAVWKYYDRFD